MSAIGKAFNIADFVKYLDGIQFGDWKPSLVVIHHCGAPSLAQRPVGFKQQHMVNLDDYYKNTKGWSSGPHLFTDEDEIWLLYPLTAKGVHAISFNRNAWAIEMLGDYDVEDPWSGRGLQVLEMTAKAAAAMLRRLGLGVEAIRFHRDDPKTSKTCPGNKISKEQFVALVKKFI